jgi:hypothetical protein
MKHVSLFLSLVLISLAFLTQNVLGDDATTFTSVRLSVDDKGSGVLTVDSRPAGEVEQPEPSSSEPADLKIFGKATISKLKDGRLDVTYDFKKVTEIADVIPSFLPPPARTALEKQLSIDGDEGVVVLIPNETKRIQLPFPRMIRPPFEMQVDLIGHADGLLQLTAAPGNHLIGVSLHGDNTPEKDVEPRTVVVFERPGPKGQFKNLLKIAHGSSEQRKRQNSSALSLTTCRSETGEVAQVVGLSY